MELFKASILKEIYWHHRSYPTGDTIHLDRDEMEELSAAGVIGDIKPMAVNKEYAVDNAPESAMRQHGQKRRR